MRNPDVARQVLREELFNDRAFALTASRASMLNLRAYAVELRQQVLFNSLKKILHVHTGFGSLNGYGERAPTLLPARTKLDSNGEGPD